MGSPWFAWNVPRRGSSRRVEESTLSDEPAAPGYFLVTFTIPQPLRAIFRSHQRLCYDLLFTQSARTLQEIARQPRYLGGDLGMLGVLHTWSRQLSYHPHVHYLIPARPPAILPIPHRHLGRRSAR